MRAPHLWLTRLRALAGDWDLEVQGLQEDSCRRCLPDEHSSRCHCPLGYLPPPLPLTPAFSLASSPFYEPPEDLPPPFLSFSETFPVFSSFSRSVPLSMALPPPFFAFLGCKARRWMV